MAVLTFEKIRVQDLDQRLIDAIKAYFNSGNVRISVTLADSAEKPFEIGSLSELLARNEADDVVYQVPSEEFDKIVEQFQADESFDPVAAIEKFAVHRQPVEST